MDLAGGQQVYVFLREIVPPDAHQFGGSKITGGQRNVRGRAAKHAVHLPVRRFDGETVASFRDSCYQLAPAQFTAFRID